MQFENTRPENSGLQSTIAFYADLVSRFGISLADAIVYGGIVAIQECGGPVIPFNFGRIDVTEGGPEDRLPGPAATAQEIVDIFMARMGFTLDETVALIGGGHTIGRVHAENTLGVNAGPMDTTDTKFDNLYFQNLLKEVPPDGVTRLIADGNMAANAQMRPVIEKFSRDNDAFISAFVRAYEKMSKLGAKFRPGENSTVPEGMFIVSALYYVLIAFIIGNLNSGSASNNGTLNNGTLPSLTQPASGVNPIQVPTPTWAPVNNNGPVVPSPAPGAPIVGVPESPPGKSTSSKVAGSTFIAQISVTLFMLAQLLLN